MRFKGIVINGPLKNTVVVIVPVIDIKDTVVVVIVGVGTVAPVKSLEEVVNTVVVIVKVIQIVNTVVVVVTSIGFLKHRCICWDDRFEN